MTNEEAIEILKAHHMWTGEPQEIIDVRKENKALDMAIQALSQEPTRDIEKSNFSQEQYLLDTDSAYQIGYEQGRKDAEQKSGKWINDKNDIPICSRCGYIPQFDRAIDDYEYSNYCPSCGAKMESEDKG